MTAGIELLAVRKTFHEGEANAFHAVDGIDLTIPAGGVTALAGPSGSGKTTLLTLIGCLARPTEGRVRLDARDISGLPEPFLAALRRQTFGFVFQRFNLVAGLTVLENVMLPAYPLGTPHRTLTRHALGLLDRLGIGHRANAPVATLSGGEAQRTAIARALINDPPVLIADEPTANLDTALSLAFLEIVADLRSEGRSLLLSSHDPLILGATVVDRLVELRDGRVISDRQNPEEPPR